jgi:hypothetical protein
MVQLTTEQRTFVIKTFYETNTLQQARVAFGLITLHNECIFQFPTVKECDLDEYVAISHRYGLRKVS